MRATKKQLKYLNDLGYTGPKNISLEDASELIAEYKKAREAARKQEWEKIQARLFCPFCETKTKRVLKHKPYRCTNCGNSIYYIEPRRAMGTKAEYKKSLQPLSTRFIILLFKFPFILLDATISVVGKIGIAFSKITFRIVHFGGKTAIKAGKKAAPVIGKAAVTGARIAKDNAPAVGAAIAKGATAAKDAAVRGVETVKEMVREEPEFRTWTTADGKQQVTARLVGMGQNGKVRLQKEDQKIAEISPQLLCDADREYLDSAIIDVE